MTDDKTIPTRDDLPADLVSLRKVVEIRDGVYQIRLHRRDGLVAIVIHNKTEKDFDDPLHYQIYMQVLLWVYRRCQKTCNTWRLEEDPLHEVEFTSTLTGKTTGQPSKVDYSKTVWIMRAKLASGIKEIRDLGIHMYHDAPHNPVTIKATDYSPIRQMQDEADALATFVDRVNDGIDMSEALKQLVDGDKFVGSKDAKPDKEDTDTVKLDRSFLTEVKPLPLGHDIRLASELVTDIMVGDFVPAKQRVGLYCGRDNVGKTAWLLHLASILTRDDKRVLYITTDQDAVDLTPYLHGLGCKIENIHVFSAKSAVLTVSQLQGLINAFNKEFGKLDLLIIDSAADVVIEAAPCFLPEGAKVFNEYRAADWKIAFTNFINPLAVHNDIAILGTLHSTPKGELNEHAVPLSHRLPGLVEFCFMIFDRDVNPKGAWDKSLIHTLKTSDTDTRLIYCRRTRSGSKRRHYFYDLGDETEYSIGKDCVRSIVNVREAVADTSDVPVAHGSNVKCMGDVLRVIAHKAGGRGQLFKISESAALKALNCYGTRQAPDAESRRKLYDKAKLTGLLDVMGDNNKGFKIWVATEAINTADFSSRGNQD